MIKFALILGIFISSLPVFASEIQLKILGNEVSWITAQQKNGYFIPSQWTEFPNVPKASSWIPVGVNHDRSHYVTFTNGVDSVQVYLPIIGFQYYSPDTFQVKNSKKSGAQFFNEGGHSFYVTGEGASSKILELDVVNSPFSKVKPIYQLDQKALIDALQNADMPKGIYKANITYHSKYDYSISNTSASYMFSGMNSFVVDYTPSNLAKLSVSGEDKLKLNYKEKVFSGETFYDIEASGVFSNGVSVGLQRALHKSNRYALESENKDGTYILYDVTCISGCEKNMHSFIKEGQANIDMNKNKATILSLDKKSAKAKIRISFKDKPLSEVNDGIYKGKFTLIFQENI